MQTVDKEMNETAIALSHNAANVMSLKSKNGEDVWVSELENSIWRSSCTKIMPSGLFEKGKTFQCDIRVYQLCFTHTVNTMANSV